MLVKLNEGLVAAAAEGSIEGICKLIDDGADVDCIAPAGNGSSGGTPIALPSVFFCNILTGTALHQASRYGHEDAVRALIEVARLVQCGACEGHTCFAAACVR